MLEKEHVGLAGGYAVAAMACSSVAPTVRSSNKSQPIPRHE